MQSPEQTRARGGRIAIAAFASLLALFLVLSAERAPAAPPTTGTADLTLTKTDSVDPATAGKAFEYTITVTNNGPDAAANTVVTDKLANGLTLVSATTTKGTCTTQGPQVTCDLNQLASGATATITLRVKAQDAGSISNTATVTSDAADPNTADNADTETTQVKAGQPNVPNCHGTPATIVGTSGADVIKGTPQRDVILARGGDDEITALGGNDRICAGRGDDIVRAGAGDDVVFGAEGHDDIRGRAGNDTIRGQRQGDVLRGGADDDLVVGGRGIDRCRGGRGMDIVRSCEN